MIFSFLGVPKGLFQLTTISACSPRRLRNPDRASKNILAASLPLLASGKRCARRKSPALCGPSSRCEYFREGEGRRVPVSFFPAAVSMFFFRDLRPFSTFSRKFPLDGLVKIWLALFMVLEPTLGAVSRTSVKKAWPPATFEAATPAPVG